MFKQIATPSITLFEAISQLCVELYPDEGQVDAWYKARIEKPKGTPIGCVFMAHGLGGSAEQFMDLTQALVDEKYLVCVLRLPGHYNEHELSISEDQYSEFCRRLSEEFIGLKRYDIPIHLIGLSFGASVIRALFDDRKDMIKSCILAAPFMDPESIIAQYVLRLLQVIDHYVPFHLGRAIAQFIPDTQSNRDSQLPAHKVLPALAVYRAWRFANSVHRKPLDPNARLRIIQTQADRTVCNSIVWKVYLDCSFKLLEQYPHMMFDHTQISQEQRKRLHRTLINSLKSGEFEPTPIPRPVRTPASTFFRRSALPLALCVSLMWLVNARRKR